MVGYSGNYQQFTPHPELIVKLFYLLLQRWQIQSFVNEHDKDPMQEWWWRHHCGLKKKWDWVWFKTASFYTQCPGNFFSWSLKKTIQKSINGRTKISNFHINRTASVVRGPKTQKHRRPRERARGQKRFASLQLFIAAINKLRLTHALIPVLDRRPKFYGRSRRF